ncbi:MAG: histidinol dehydrogenase [Clostridiales bacterium]|jgi:histidinol dehydrogenase|nr:histidinol dehydrogenase [Clostridiales bacterium]
MIARRKYKDGIDEFLKNRAERVESDNAAAQEFVDAAIRDVRREGDEALLRYTRRFDSAVLSEQTLRVSDDEMKEAIKSVDAGFMSILRKACARIEEFHKRQLRNSWFDMKENGEMMGQITRPIESCGIYVPGGKAAYPSTLIMNAIPAKVAGVKRIIAVTPASADGKARPSTLAAAHAAGVGEIYKVGGAQAIAALAFGTKTIPKVDKIVGPGNIFVATAKKSVFGNVSIDSVAGPSEILVVADESANPAFVAADMLSQAEHDEMASAVLITTSEKFADDVEDELERQAESLSRKDVIEKSLEGYGMIITVENLDQAVEISNILAPEHLEISTSEPFALLPAIKNAGAIFLGSFSPEPLGDYMAGPNHVLPTGGTARFFSPLSVDDFLKKSSFISFSKSALESLSDDICAFAETEGLTAHSNAIKARRGF